MPRRVVTTSQPQHAAQIDWGNPITRGLVFAFLPTSVGSDAVGGRWLRSGTQVISNSAGGSALLSGHTANCFTRPGAPSPSQASFLAVLTRRSTTTGTICGFASTNSSFKLAAETGASLSILKGGVAVVGSVATPLDQPIAVFAEHNPAANNATLLVRNLITGVVTNGGGANASAAGASNGNIAIGGAGYDIHFAAGWGRAFSGRDLLYNPWQVFL